MPKKQTAVAPILVESLQPPFRQKDMLEAERFCKYCCENGIRITLEDLETLHEEGLLFPVVKVELGVCEFRRIHADFDGVQQWRWVAPEHMEEFKPTAVEIQQYWTTGSLMYGRDNWLDFYESYGLVSFPASQPFVPWERKLHADFTFDIDEADGVYRFMYDKHQLLCLQIIHSATTYNSQITPTDRSKCQHFIKERIVEAHKFISLCIEIERARECWFERNTECYQTLCKEFGEENAGNEWALEFDGKLLPEMSREAEEILNSSDLSLAEIERWLSFLGRQSMLTSQKQAINYLVEVREETLARTEQLNYWIRIVSDALSLVQKTERTVKASLNYRAASCADSRYPL